MVQLIRFLLTVLLVLPSLVQAASVTPQYCYSKEISHMDVGACTCQGHKDMCNPPPTCSTCTWQIKERKTNSCYPGCTDNDKNCFGCGLWFTTLCDCIKNPTKCPHTGTVQPNGPMIWILLTVGQHLVTTTDPLPGILEMAKNYKKYGGGFDFAQEKANYNPAKEALALNSVRSRTQEQFHIHVCHRPTTQNPRVIAILDKAKHNPTKELKQIPGHDLYCVTVEKGKGPIKDFAESIHNLLDVPTPPVCRGLAGAAIIQDSYQNTWGCVTGSKDGPLADFCAGS